MSRIIDYIYWRGDLSFKQEPFNAIDAAIFSQLSVLDFDAIVPAVGEVIPVWRLFEFYISQGFAHGFLVLSDTAEFCYKVTDFYRPGDEGGLAWNDPEIGIEWPELIDTQLILSEKDRMWPGLKDTFQFSEEK